MFKSLGEGQWGAERGETAYISARVHEQVLPACGIGFQMGWSRLAYWRMTTLVADRVVEDVQKEAEALFPAIPQSSCRLRIVTASVSVM